MYMSFLHSFIAVTSRITSLQSTYKSVYWYNTYVMVDIVVVNSYVLYCEKPHNAKSFLEEQILKDDIICTEQCHA